MLPKLYNFGNKKINAARILLVFRSLVSQLAKENEKFIYGCIKSGARAREFEEAIEWLVSSGLVIRVYDIIVKCGYIVTSRIL